MRKKLPTFFVLLAVAALGLHLNPARAQTAADYSAVVPVTDQGDAARAPALQAALSVVIARITGDAGAASGRAAPLLSRAGNLTQQYSYLTDAQGQPQLQATFDARQLDTALHGLGYSVWGIAPAPVDEVALAISGVDSPQQYARLLSYLQNLPGLSRLSVVELSGTTLHLRLRVEGGAPRLAGAFSIGGVLARGTGSNPGEQAYSLIH
jgi:hypothetical protein